MDTLEAGRHIQLMDTTLRDGEQTQGVSFSANEKVNIARALLQSLKVDRIEVASACVSDGEQRAVAQITEWAAQEGMLERVEVLGFVDHRRSVDWIVAAGGKVINLLAKGSEYVPTDQCFFITIWVGGVRFFGGAASYSRLVN